ncbi:PilZ domain-containing protein [Geomonas sp. Red32]|uniref:PilZ domain-containing protein n=1 Tax=Geomonas sp. Red32 TaxID=2912856 RepID=UPI00202CE3FE|nr:PilZ domain-containing protein [Geomonas sp. Red32]MCM0080992.1 PilZ domain-containing protein [Geomonas sp. Red32]
MDSDQNRTLPAPPNADEQQAFIDRFACLMAGDGDPRIVLTNIYKEMPISHPASLWEVKGNHIELETCELQLAAISHCSEAYIQSPLVETPVLAQLESIDIRRCTVRLHNFSYCELYVNRRSAVRVRFKRPVNMVATAAGCKIHGLAHDISLEGCCLLTLTRPPLTPGDPAELQLHLLAPLTNETLDVEIPSTVIRIAGETPPYKLVLGFGHTQHSEHLLSVYINQRQHELLKELRASL